MIQCLFFSRFGGHMHRRVRGQIYGLLSVAVFCISATTWTGAALAAPSESHVRSSKPSKSAKSPTLKPSSATAVVRQYIDAVASGNKAATGRLDFACQYRMVATAPSRLSTFPADPDPVYET